MKNLIDKHMMCKLLVFTLLVSLFSGGVIAFGVGSLYSDSKPLELSIGETKEVIFNFQNPQGNDIKFRSSIKEGSEVIVLIDTEDVLLQVGDSINVRANVIVPENAQVGNIYPIELSFTTISDEVGGTLGLGSSVGRKFNLVIVPTAEEVTLTNQVEEVSDKGINNWIVLLAIAIIVIIIVILIVAKHNNINQNNNSKKVSSKKKK